MRDTYKRCSTCRITKSIDHYYIQRHRKDQHQYVCKACYLVYQQARKARFKARPDSAVPKLDNKWCCGCGHVLPPELFSRNRTQKDGLQSFCKACAKLYREDRKQERLNL